MTERHVVPQPPRYMRLCSSSFTYSVYIGRCWEFMEFSLRFCIISGFLFIVKSYFTWAPSCRGYFYRRKYFLLVVCLRAHGGWFRVPRFIYTLFFYNILLRLIVYYLFFESPECKLAESLVVSQPPRYLRLCPSSFTCCVYIRRILGTHEVSKLYFCYFCSLFIREFGDTFGSARISALVISRIHEGGVIPCFVYALF